MKKYFYISLLITLACISCTANRKEKTLANSTETYLTVGQKNCDYTSLSEALAAFNSEYDLIYIMDAVITESGISVTKNVTISGFGMNKTSIQGGRTAEEATDRIFRVEKEGNLNIRDLSIENGQAVGDFRCGGAISNSGNVSLENCRIAGNTAVYGAGIWSEGTLTLKNCQVKDNHTIPANSAEIKSALGCTGSGGGIKNEPHGILILESCEITGNSSLKKGGGVFMSCESINTLTNCILKDNSSVNNGGAIQLRGDLVMESCIIENNSSVKGTGGFFNYGKLSFSGNTIRNNSGGDYKNGDGGFGFYGKGIIEKDENNQIKDRLN